MLSTAIVSNIIIYSQPKVPKTKQKNQSSSIILVGLWLHVSLVITLIVW